MHYKFCGDWIFWAELSQKGDVLRFTHLLNYFRKNGGTDVTGNVVKSGLNYIEDVNALMYFRKNFICNNGQVMKAIKRYFFSYKKDRHLITNDNSHKIYDNFANHLGKRKMLLWNIKYKKNSIALSIYNKLKENI